MFVYNVGMKKEIYFKLLTVLTIISIFFTLSGCGSRRAVSDTRFILDTVCTITVGGSDNPEKIISEAFDAATAIENKIDYYDTSSVVSVFNGAEAGTPVALDDDTYNIVSRALEVSESSGGAFDITIAPVNDLWDFKSENHVVPDAEQIQSRLKAVGYEKLVLDSGNKTLTKTENGVKIDLGGCGKGYCCQAALDYISENYPDCYAILDFGGNVSVYGKNPRRADGSFSVGIQDPEAQTGVYSQTVSINSGESVVTSGTYQRHFMADGVNYHHILDPATGFPAQTNISSVSIVCGSSLTADCLSTACLVLGKEDGTALAEKYGAQSIWIETDADY